jgi:23S rRNA (cytidine1920-2'-O)/16S rRNA (cytidine1409-2'-O)-methyltransferase
VAVLERQNALHTAPVELVDLVVVDLSWTPQRLCVPVALAWLKPGGKIISLVKPHYELKSAADAGGPVIELPRGGILDEAIAEDVTRRIVDTLPSLGAKVLGLTKSPILGGKAGAKANAAAGSGNAEWLVLLEKA